MKCFIFLAILLVALVSYAFIKKAIKKKEEEKQDLEARTMPSGLILPRDEAAILAYRKNDLSNWDREDLRFFVNFVGHKAAKLEIGSPERKPWDILFIEASRALYQY